jgi:hypothetical protein
MAVVLYELRENHSKQKKAGVIEVELDQTPAMTLAYREPLCGSLLGVLASAGCFFGSRLAAFLLGFLLLSGC